MCYLKGASCHLSLDTASPNHQPQGWSKSTIFDIPFLRELEPLKPDSSFTPEGIGNQNGRFTPTLGAGGRIHPNQHFTITISGSVGLKDYWQVDMLGLQYISVNFGVKTDWPRQIGEKNETARELGYIRGMVPSMGLG